MNPTPKANPSSSKKISIVGSYPPVSLNQALCPFNCWPAKNFGVAGLVDSYVRWALQYILVFEDQCRFQIFQVDARRFFQELQLFPACTVSLQVRYMMCTNAFSILNMLVDKHLFPTFPTSFCKSFHTSQKNLTFPPTFYLKNSSKFPATVALLGNTLKGQRIEKSMQRGSGTFPRPRAMLRHGCVPLEPKC